MPPIALRVGPPNGDDGPTVAFPADTVLSESNADDLAGELAALVAAHGPRLTIDLGNVAVLTSVILGKLLALHNQLRADGGRLALRNPTPTVHLVFKVTKLEGVFDIRAAAG